MLVAIVLATVCLASSRVLAAYEKTFYDVEDAENLFNDFLKEHQKVYNRREYYERLEIFKETLKDINERNAMFPDTVFALNNFADLKPHEKEQYLGFKLPVNITKVSIPHFGPTPVPIHFDWRDRHAVSHVKDQKKCGSCYIFSAVGDIEGQYAIKHNQCLALSEAQALECLDCGSCCGGTMLDVMQELAARHKKLEKESDYPYDVIKTKNHCHEHADKGVVQVTSGQALEIKDEDDLLHKLINLGPLAVALNANDIYHYHGGIVYPNKCKSKDVDHGVVLVGYGEENGILYWIIKNSWGTKWGEKGFFRLLRGVNACNMGTSYTAHSQVA